MSLNLFLLQYLDPKIIVSLSITSMLKPSVQWFPSDDFLPVIQLILPWFFDILDQMKELKNLSGDSKG